MTAREIVLRRRPWARYVASLTAALGSGDFTQTYAELARAYNFQVEPLDKDRVVTYAYLEPE